MYSLDTGLALTNQTLQNSLSLPPRKRETFPGMPSHIPPPLQTEDAMFASLQQMAARDKSDPMLNVKHYENPKSIPSVSSIPKINLGTTPSPLSGTVPLIFLCS